MRILVTAGPTREHFDSVRFISNASTGKMGYALAAEAAKRGHKVTLVSGPVSLRPPRNVNVVQVVSADEMARAAKLAWRQCDAAVMTAAVCDYRPVDCDDRKIAKSHKRKRLALEPTEDIAASLGKRKAKRILIGFAMEDADEPYALAERKLQRKNCDMIVLNGPDNVGTDRATVEFFLPQEGWLPPIEGTKATVAKRIITFIEMLSDSKG